MTISCGVRNVCCMCRCSLSIETYEGAGSRTYEVDRMSFMVLCRKADRI